MKAVILAAGEGTRLRPLTRDCPKPMLPIAGKPLLEHTAEWLKGHGFAEIAINLHHRPAAIMSHFGDGSRLGVRVTYSIETVILGTAGALKALSGFLDSTFAVVYGDVLTDLDLGALCRFHCARRMSDPSCVATLSLYRVPDPTACGIVEIDCGNRVLRLLEKPKPQEVFGDLAFSGVLIAEPEMVDAIPPGAFCDLGFHTFPLLLRGRKTLYGLPLSADEYLIDIGSHEKYAEACRGWASRRASQ